jgi:hypothetical protein
VQIGAILTVAAEDADQGPLKRGDKGTGTALSVPPYVTRSILGTSLIDRTIERLKLAGAVSIQTLKGAAFNHVFPWRSAKATPPLVDWEEAVSRQINEGIEHLLLLRLAAYSDLDCSSVIQFHSRSGSPLTQVYAPSGSLDMAIVNAKVLRESDHSYCKTISGLIPQQRRFLYRGYVNRLATPEDFFNLVRDGLYGACGLRPTGREVRQGIWLGDGACVDSTASLTAPIFIGENSLISPDCTITGTCSIERDCKIDVGSSICQSCIFPETYIGPALNVRRSLVQGSRLFHLDRKVEISIADPQLAAANSPSSLFSGLGSWVWGTAQQAD